MINARYVLAERELFAPSSRSRSLQNFLRLMWQKKLGTLGGVIVIALVLTAAIGPLFAPYDPLELRLEEVLAAPGSSHLLGTDTFGRDMLSRLIYGARLSVTVGFAATLVGSTTGALVALISGYLGGRIDMLTQRIMDMLQAIPVLVLALTIVAALGPSLINVIYAIAFAQIPGANRVVRSQTLAIKEREYIAAAIAAGASARRVIFVHIMPNCVAPYLIIVSAAVGTAIVAEASLGFLGLGIPPPAPSWGGMLSTAQRYVDTNPGIAVFPGLAISLAVFGFNLLGDALRDILDPRLRGSR